MSAWKDGSLIRAKNKPCYATAARASADRSQPFIGQPAMVFFHLFPGIWNSTCREWGINELLCLEINGLVWHGKC
jgi:hypothetical protein